MTERFAHPATLFSTERFLSAWLSVAHHNYENAAIISLPLGEDVVLFGICHPLGTSHAEFGPHGLYAAPIPTLPEAIALDRRLRAALASHRLSSFIWNVRFDHEELIVLLRNAGLDGASSPTYVLPLTTTNHGDVFAGYNSTRRNEIRRAHRRGVTIRRAASRADVEQYYELHRKLELAKNFSTQYPLDLIHALAGLEDSILLLAEVNERVIAGGLFFMDGDSMFYWHGAADRSASEFFATAALIDAAVQLACAFGMRSVNFGASPTDSLRFFKKSFGAEERTNCSFQVRAEPSPAKVFIDRAAQRLSRLRRG